MLKLSFKLAFRNLRKHKLASSINILGLSVGVAACLVAWLWTYNTLTEDRFHENGENIFLVEQRILEDNEIVRWGTTPAPLGPAIEADLPGVIRAVRIGKASGAVRVDDNEIGESIRFVDDGFFDMFTFPLASGVPSALADEGSVILSAEAAVRHFGKDDPLGRHLTIALGANSPESFVVVGVAAPFPSNIDIRFELLLNYAKWLEIKESSHEDWSVYTAATFIQVSDVTDVNGIVSQMDTYLGRRNAASPEWLATGFGLDNLFALTRSRADVNSSIAGRIRPEPIILLATIASFLLLLSCLNTVNIAVASASARLREIGIRKVMGSSRGQLVRQLLAENVLICLLGLVAGVVVASSVFLPALSEAGLNLRLDLAGGVAIWMFLTGLLVFTGVASGAYPAFFISSHRPAVILRGRQALGRRRSFTHLLLGVQFLVAFITMAVGVAFAVNTMDQVSRDWGYDQENTLSILLGEGDRFSPMYDVAISQAGVLAATGAEQQVGMGGQWSDATIDNTDLRVLQFGVGDRYLETTGIRMKAGRFLDGGALVNPAVVNQTFVTAANWTDPIGQAIRVGEASYVVVGVAEDFHHDDFSRAIAPVVFRRANPTNNRVLTMRTEPGTEGQTLAALTSAWASLGTDREMAYRFQAELFDTFYTETRQFFGILGWTAVLALLISCMGLFGLASQDLRCRMKEMSIRRVLGASISEVVVLLNRRFLLLLGLAAAIATPLSYVMLGTLLDALYSYHVGVSVMAYAITYVMVLATVGLTLMTQIGGIASASPAEAMRLE